ncbi:MAG TPA: sigma-70 family RNA polymerase sigma factor [Gemmatimonadales bacterium]|nr:sigma-70 family RNA polymerase sigma factor [Gemmatimonadales bacterium]
MSHARRLSQEEERSLLERLLAHDERALGELYDLLAPWVLGLATRILADEDDAEEVLGTVFEQVWSRIHLHDPQRGPLVPWVLSIARNRSVDLLRRRRRWWRKAQRVEREWLAGADVVAAVADRSGAEAAVPGWPVHRAVHQALAELPPEQRRVVVLAYFEGLSHAEIARRTGDPLGTVKTRMRLAHRKLEDALVHLRDWTE